MSTINIRKYSKCLILGDHMSEQVSTRNVPVLWNTSQQCNVLEEDKGFPVSHTSENELLLHHWKEALCTTSSLCTSLL